MRINHNIAAIRANNQLQKTNKGMNASIEKLTSGYSINRAADDAAGMAISQKMKTQIRGLERASQNAADGISVIQTAEGALSEVEAMLQRMRELSVQASNGTNTADDRESIQKEIEQLNQEIQRISDTTEFNTRTLLNGDADRKSYSSNSKIQLISLSDAVEEKDYNITVTKEGSKATVNGLVTAIGDAATPNAITAAQAGIVNINGEEIEISKGDTITSIYEKLRDVCEKINVSVSPVDATGAPVEVAAATNLNFETKECGSTYYLHIGGDEETLTALGLQNSTTKVNGTDAEIKLYAQSTVDDGTGGTTTVQTEDFKNTTTWSANGNKVTITDVDGFKMKVEIQEGTIVGNTPVDTKFTILSQGPINLQIGANEGQTVKVSIPEVSPITLGIENINLCTEDGAQAAITAVDNAINEVSLIRAKLGAYQNRLDHAIASLDITGENMTEALSRIEDTDMAEEMSNYTQKNVLSQAGTSMLAQANQQPQTVLSLLQG